MSAPRREYWKIRLAKLQAALERKDYEVFVVESLAEARQRVLDVIVPATKAQSVSWGGSMSFKASGLYEALKDRPDMTVIDTYDTTVTREEILERRRRALHVDLFFTGTNAVTEAGQLVNLDNIGNRVASLTFGPRHVVVLAGRNKVVPDLEAAMSRIKRFAAPVNAIRLQKKTPCTKTGECEDCHSPDRICTTWTITERSFPKGRVRVVLVNEDLGI